MQRLSPKPLHSLRVPSATSPQNQPVNAFTPAAIKSSSEILACIRAVRPLQPLAQAQPVQNALAKPLYQAREISPDLIISPDGIPIEFLRPTENRIGDFMLGHMRVGGSQYHWCKTKTALELLQDKIFIRRDFPELNALDLLFPTDTPSPENPRSAVADTASRKLFMKNPALRQVHRVIADHALEYFGLTRPSQTREIEIDSSFTAIDRPWVNDKSVKGVWQRRLLSKIIRSLYLLENRKLAINLFKKARSLIYPHVSADELAIFDNSLKNIAPLRRKPAASPAIQIPKRVPPAKSSTGAVARFSQEVDNTLRNKIISELHFDGSVTKYFYNNEKLIGCINFPHDQHEKHANTNRVKYLTYRNPKTVLFEYNSWFYTPEMKARTNSYNHFFDTTKHIIPAYFFEKDKMVSRNAGSLNGEEAVNTQKRAPLKLFLPALRDVDFCQQNHIYLSDIKPSNMVFEQDDEGNLTKLNLIDVDIGIIDTAKDKGKPQIAFTPWFYHPKLKDKIDSINDKTAKNEIDKALKSNNYYCFLLSMYWIHSQGVPYQSIAEHFSAQNQQVTKQRLARWINSIAMPNKTESLLAFLENPYENYLEDLKDCINWDKQLGESAKLQLKPIKPRIFIPSSPVLPARAIPSPKPTLLSYQQRCFQGAANLLRDASLDLQDNQKLPRYTDELGNQIYAKAQNEDQKSQYFYHQDRFIGCIDTKLDKHNSLEKHGENKNITHQNKQYVFFQMLRDVPLANKHRANAYNSFLDASEHIVPGYYVENNRMIARNAGEINGEQMQKNGGRAPIHLFQGLLEDLEQCHQHGIYLTDIKPSNLVFQLDAKGRATKVSLVDVDMGLVDTTLAVAQIKDQPICTTHALFHSGLREAISAINEQTPKTEVNRLFKQHIYYIFLLSLYWLHHGMQDTHNINAHFAPENQQHFKKRITPWIKEVAANGKVSILREFIENPHLVQVDSLASLINWQYVHPWDRPHTSD